MSGKFEGGSTASGTVSAAEKLCVGVLQTLEQVVPEVESPSVVPGGSHWVAWRCSASVRDVHSLVKE